MNQSLRFALILLFILSKAAFADVTNGIIGWWNFDDISGNTATDISSHFGATAHNGTMPVATVDSYVPGNSGGVSIGQFFSQADKYIASYFTAGSSYTLTEVDIPITKSGTPAGNLTCYIYSDSGNAPNAQVGTASGTVSANSTGTIAFTGMNVPIVSGTKYWIAVSTSGEPGDGVNYAQWQYTTDAGNGKVYQSSNGSSWSAATNATVNTHLQFTTKGSPLVNGKIGKGINLASASSQYVDTGDISGTNSASAITLAAWVKWTTIVSDQVIVGKYNDGASFGHGLQGFQTASCNTSGQIIFFINVGSSFVCTTGAPANQTGVWYHIVGTFDNALGSNKYRIYVNGASQSLTNQGTPDTFTSTGASGGVNERIGSLSAGFPRYFNGYIDDVRIYNRALTAAEVRELYESSANAISAGD